MASAPEMEATSDARPGEETRRSLLAKAGAVGGGLGLIALTRAERAAAEHNLPNPPPSPGSGTIEVSNVKDWGAVGDGVHDDRPNIQACINDSAGKAAVYLPPGTYRMASGGASMLVMPSDTYLFGDGKFSVLRADRATTVAAVINNAGGGAADNVRIEDLVVDCNSNTHAFGIKMAGSSTSPCRNCFLRRVEVKNVTLPSPNGSQPSYALHLAYWKDGAVQDCYVHHTQRDGLVMTGDGCVVSGNVVEDCGDNHIVAVGTDTGGIVVVGNVINANTSTRGAGINPRRRATVVGNVVFGGVHAGIELYADYGGADDTVIAGNVILESGNSSGTARPEGMLYGSAQGSGISFLTNGNDPANSTIRRVHVADNVIAKPRSNGIMFAHGLASGTIQQITICGNKIYMEDPGTAFPDPNLARRGIALRGGGDSADPAGPITGVQIRGNEVIDAKGEGIYAKGSLIEKIDVHGNVVSDSGTSTNPSVGIRLDTVRDASVIANRAYDTTGSQEWGLDVRNCSGTLIIVANDLWDNGAGPATYQATTAGPSRLRIRDNPGWNPWAGQVTTPFGAWTSFQPYAGGPTYYRMDVVVTFEVPFPSGTTPKVIATPRAEGYSVAVIAGVTPDVSQTLRVWVPENINPNTSVTVNWIAEPVD